LSTVCGASSIGKSAAGETVDESVDYVAPPLMLSSESSANEIIWSRGRYVTPAEVAAAFALKSRCRRRSTSRPINRIRTRSSRACSGSSSPRASLAWIGIGAAYPRKNAFTAQLTFAPVATADSRHATGTVGCTRRRKRHPPPARSSSPNHSRSSGTGSLHILAGLSIDNSWGHLAGDLINEETGFVQEFDLPMEYYHGTDDGEGWSEGNRSTSIQVPPVRPATTRCGSSSIGEKMHESLRRRIYVVEGGTRTGMFQWLLFFLFLIPFVNWIRYRKLRGPSLGDLERAPDEQRRRRRQLVQRRRRMKRFYMFYGARASCSTRPPKCAVGPRAHRAVTPSPATCAAHRADIAAITLARRLARRKIMDPLIKTAVMSLAFSVLGLAVFAVAMLIIVKVTPFSIRKEIENRSKRVARNRHRLGVHRPRADHRRRRSRNNKMTAASRAGTALGRRVTPILFLHVLLISTCGLVYELLAGTLAAISSAIRSRNFRSSSRVSVGARRRRVALKQDRSRPLRALHRHRARCPAARRLLGAVALLQLLDGARVFWWCFSASCSRSGYSSGSSCRCSCASSRTSSSSRI